MGKSSERYIEQRAWEQEQQELEEREEAYLYARSVKERNMNETKRETAHKTQHDES